MANTERLTKRVKKMEDWVKENEDMGGPRGYLDTFVFLLNEARSTSTQMRQAQTGFNQMREYAFEFIKENDLAEEWDKFIQEKETDAVQKQQTEEVPLQEEAESGEETVEAPVEEKEG